MERVASLLKPHSIEPLNTSPLTHKNSRFHQTDKKRKSKRKKNEAKEGNFSEPESKHTCSCHAELKLAALCKMNRMYNMEGKKIMQEER